MDFKDFRFTKDHEWVKIDGDSVLLGITDHAQKELGDIVYVDLPSEGDSVSKGDAFSNIESVKAVSDVNTPVSGEIESINEELEDQPELINSAPYEKGWIAKIKLENAGELEELMNYDSYTKFLEEAH